MEIIKRIEIFSLLLSLFFFSCNFSATKNKEWKENVESTINNWKGKSIILPDSLIIIDKENSIQRMYLEEFQSKFKIVTFIDADCSVCLNNFSYWNTFINESNSKKYDCDFLIFVNINKSQWMNIRTLKFAHSFIIDSACQFVEKNQLWDKRFQTTLINDKNEVIIIGDPTVNKELGELYKNVLSNPRKYHL